MALHCIANSLSLSLSLLLSDITVSLLGLVSDARALLQSPELIKEVKGSGLLLATYGDEK